MLTLTVDGILPPGRYKCSPSEIFDLFVKPYPTSNRESLFTYWQEYDIKLKAFTGGQKLIQWVDGSFITNKLNPGDIDFVTFIPYHLYEPLVDELIDYYTTFSLYDHGLDAYICPVYLSTHSEYVHFVSRRQYWQKLFGSQKDNLNRKGFLELTL